MHGAQLILALRTAASLTLRAVVVALALQLLTLHGAR
jgi:hypothetical protein